MDPNDSTNSQLADADILENGFSDIDDLDQGSQLGHNNQNDNAEDDSDEDFSIGYQDSTEDENDIQRASNRNTVFKYMKDEEDVDSKTIMRGEVGQSTLVSNTTKDDDIDEETIMIVETDADTGNEFDYGIRDDGDSGDDTTGRTSNQDDDISGYYDHNDTPTGRPDTHG